MFNVVVFIVEINVYYYYLYLNVIFYEHNLFNVVLIVEINAYYYYYYYFLYLNVSGVCVGGGGAVPPNAKIINK